MSDERGALYIATGRKFIEEAEISLKILKRSLPNLSTAIVTEDEKRPEGFDRVIKMGNPSFGFKDKIKGLEKTPYEKTLFLDTDTYVVRPIEELFSILDKFDIGVAQNQNRDLHTSNIGVPESFPEYSTGVMVFKRDRTRKLIRSWKNEYKEEHNGDQTSFRKSLYESGVRIATLTREYNYSVRSPAHIVKPIKIIHGRILDAEFESSNKYYDVEKVKCRIEDEIRHKILTRGGFERGSNPPVLDRIKLSVRERGILNTINRIVKKLIYGGIGY